MVASGPVRKSLVVTAVVALGCGPSVRGVHQSNLRFEHCNRLDLDGDVAPTHRLACWREWLHDPTVGQTDDRRAYAALRVAAIEAGEQGPLVLALAPASGATSALAPASAGPVVAPPPLDPHGSPPAVVAPPAPAATESASAAPSAAPARIVPAAACQDLCTTAWTACGKACDDAPKSPACLRCSTDYRACMRRCFR